MRFVIFVEGGAVQEVICSENCQYLIIDQDVEDEEARELTYPNGHKFTAAIGQYEEVAHPGTVEHYFRQAEA